MTTPTEAATLAWYAVKNDTRSPSPTADPTPYIAAIVRALDGPIAEILAAKDAEIAGLREDAEKWRFAGFACNADGVADLKRRADAAERDARRYRFLRDGYGDQDGQHIVWFSAYDVLGGPYTPEYIDAEVDAAISALAGEGEG